jgi:MEDS: MEthanogen/methylotroph, DcmR Sensory domain
VRLGHFHAVRFYDNEVSLCRIVAGFLREGLALGQPALVIAMPEHAQGIIAELRAREVDVNHLRAVSDLVVLDAAAVLAEFMVDGAPDPEKFRAAAMAAIDRARRGRAGRTIRAYSEMVDLLWKQGKDAASIQLEILWNRLARNSELSLMCGFATGSFYKDANVADVCRQHTHLINADGTARVSDADSLVISLKQ